MSFLGGRLRLHHPDIARQLGHREDELVAGDCQTDTTWACDIDERTSGLAGMKDLEGRPVGPLVVGMQTLSPDATEANAL